MLFKALNSFYANCGFLSSTFYSSLRPKEYWKGVGVGESGRQPELRLLSDFALRLLTAAASEAACERSFGYLKLLIGDRRRRMSEKTIFYLMIVSICSRI
jgi:hypothetical protein